MAFPRLSGSRVTLRTVDASDRDRLREILGQAGVRRWWGMETPEIAVADLFKAYHTALAIEVDGLVVGSLQVTEENDVDYRHASIDIFLADEHQGRGLGPDALRTIARHLFEARGHHRITIDPAAANANAIRAYERVGFRPVGVMRRYERGRDGTWHDGLLMDLLADELR